MNSTKHFNVLIIGAGPVRYQRGQLLPLIRCATTKKRPDYADIESRRRLSPLQRERRAPRPFHQTGPVLRINAIGHQAIVDAEAFG